MVADKAEDKGLFGWKEWTFPTNPILERETKPHPTKDGHYDDADYYGKEFPDKFALGSDSMNPVRYPALSPAYTLYRQYGQIPKWKTYFTGLGGALKNNSGHQCENFELQAMECLEYYGLSQGMDACKDWYDDLMECRFKTKQNLRTKHMFHKRNTEWRLEYLQGKRDHVYEEPPKFHAYIEPHLKAGDYFQSGGSF